MAPLFEPWPTKLLRLLWLASGKRPFVDAFLSRRLTYRDKAPRIDPAIAIPGFHETEICITRCPAGGWSTPLADVFIILKAALGFESQRILELGSFRGETARLLAEITPPETRIRAVDIDPRHGAAYAGLACARKIERVVGSIHPGMFAPGERFDLIFVDAAHKYEAVMQDTATAFGVLSETGVILWHDYGVGNYFSGGNGVVDALRVFSSREPIAALSNTCLAIHSRYPGWETAQLAVAAPLGAQKAPDDIWQDSGARG